MDSAISIRLLNAGVADELQAIHQYMYWHFHLDDQGFAPLSALFRRIAVQEMGHLDGLAERILFLKADVEMIAAAPVAKITEPEAILAKAVQMERDGIAAYNNAALECAANADSSSKQLFEQMVKGEEGHYDQFEKQRDHVKRFGLNYLAL